MFKEVLNQGRSYLDKCFQRHQKAEEVIVQHAWLLDQILTEAWQLYLQDAAEDLCLVAVGGYGRRELHPYSDIDLLVLYDKSLDAALEERVGQFITLLWDIRLEVGHSVRSVEQCQQEADDLTVMTNLLESRVICGAQHLFVAMKKRTDVQQVWDSAAFFEGKFKEQQVRHEQYHGTAYNLEPNLKESPGGLRDIQTIAWIAKRHCKAESWRDLVIQSYLNESEYKTLTDGQEFLWKVRYLLHQEAGRHEDRLAFQYQRSLAEKLDYKDDEKRLGVEHFMKKYYRTITEIYNLCEILLQSFREVIFYAQNQAEKEQVTAINRRFQLRNNYLEVCDPQVFAHYPFALLEIFLIYQQHAEISGIRASTARLILHYRDMIDEDFYKDIRARSLFYEIIRQPCGQTRAFRAMNLYGILSAYIPAFGDIVGQMQYDLFHVYTVDQHTLFVLRNLRRYTVAEFYDEFPLCSEISQQIPKLELAYLGALFHDIAKGRGGDHSELGQKDALVFCRQHGLSEYDSQLVAWIVKNHLLMSTTAQRQDITDPEVITHFAQHVGDLDHLNYLYLHTVSDIRATSPKLWNNWKASLLSDLYRKTKHALGQGLENPLNRVEQVQEKQETARKALSTASQTEIDDIWQNFGEEYFLRTSINDVVRDTRAVLDKPPEQVLVLSNIDKCGSYAFTIFSQKDLRLFAASCLYLERQSLNIVDAYLIGAGKGCTLLHYVVLEQNGTALKDNYRAQSIQKGLNVILQEDEQHYRPINQRPNPQVRHFNEPTRVTFEHHAEHTVMEVVTTDRPGVLSRIAQSLYRCKVHLKTAKIATLGSRVEDIFFITGTYEGGSITSEQLDCLQTMLPDELG